MICLVRLYDDRSKDPWRAESLEGEITLGLRFTKFNHGIVDPSIPAKRSMAKITLYFSFDEMFPAIRDLNPIQKSLNRVPLDLSFFTTAKASPRATSAAVRCHCCCQLLHLLPNVPDSQHISSHFL